MKVSDRMTIGSHRLWPRYFLEFSLILSLCHATSSIKNTLIRSI